MAASAVAAVGARPEGRADLTAVVVEHLRPSRALVVMDNCEHVIEAAATLAAAVLAGCPHVRLLATSRSPLACDGEAECRVPPLAAPPQTGTAAAVPSLAELRALDSVRLLADRARLVRPSFDVTDANAADVASICRKLDGLPLALELAAARLKALTPRQVADRLGDALGLLTAGPRTARPRQRTLRAVIDWSHALLDARERTALARLSVFAGPATAEAAAAVVADGAEGIAADDVPELIAMLVDKSLVVPDERADGAVRYRLLDLVRQYAAERLDAAAGERAAAEARHLAHLADLSVALYPRLAAADQLSAAAQLDAERDNIRVALDRGNGGDDAQRLVGHLPRYWLYRGNLADGLAQARGVVRAAEGRPPGRWTADMYNTAGTMAYQCGHLAEARRHYGAGLAAARALADPVAEATALTTLSTVAKDAGDLDGARRYAEAALDLRRRVGSPSAVAGAMNNLANVLTQMPAEVDAAREIYRQSRAIYADLGDAIWVSYLDLNLGELELRIEDATAARVHYAAALAGLQALGDPWNQSYAVRGLGECDVRQGHYAEGRRRLDESADVCRHYGDAPGEAVCIEGMARAHLGLGDLPAAREAALRSARLFRSLDDLICTAAVVQTLADVVARTDPARAARLIGGSDAVRAAHGVKLFGVDLTGHRKLCDGLRAALGPTAFDAGYAAGQATPIDDLLASG